MSTLQEVSNPSLEEVPVEVKAEYSEEAGYASSALAYGTQGIVLKARTPSLLIGHSKIFVYLAKTLSNEEDLVLIGKVGCANALQL